MRDRAAVFAFAAALVVATVPAHLQDPPATEDIVARAGRYITEFGNHFANVVAEERYRQEVITTAPPPNIAIRGRGGSLSSAIQSRPSTTRRELKSDFLLVTVPLSGDLVPFRDTFEVDGAEVRDREQRLTKLFINPSTTALEQATAIAEESTRYNIGNLKRTINNPVLALSMLVLSNHTRFTFTLDKLDPAVGADVWIIDYQEQSKPTLIRGASDRDLPAHGRLWIDRSSGRVVKTELMLVEPNVSARVTTTFRTDDRFKIDVPLEMHEEYLMRNSQVTGQATYGRFRRFGVQTEESLQK